MTKDKESWHLNKSVPITVIVVVILQAAAIIYAGGEMRADIDSNSRSIGRHEVTINKIEAQFHGADVKLGKIEATMESINRSLSRIERVLDQ